MLSLLQASRCCWPLVWASMPYLVRACCQVGSSDLGLGREERKHVLSRVWSPQLAGGFVRTQGAAQSSWKSIALCHKSRARMSG